MQLDRESGDLPPGWAWTTLGDSVDILDSRRVPVNSTERATRVGNVPYFGATGQVGWIDDYLFDEELVLLGEDGAPFLDFDRPKAYMIRGKSWVNNHAHVLRGRPGLLNLFLLYQLNQCDYHPYVSGTTRLKLPQAPMREIPLVLPPLPEQHRIVAAIEEQFTRLDAAVAALERARANLKRYRAAVLAAACSGRLVPTEAALARADGRDYEPAERLLARILAERRAAPRKGRARDEPAPPDTAGLPELPEGWCWASWLLVGRSQNGRAFPSSEYQDYGVKLLRPGNLYDDGYVRWTPKNTRHLPEEWADRFPDYVVGPDELIMNLTAQSLKDDFLGRTCMTGATERCLLNQRLARLTPVGIAPRYALWLLKSQVFRSFVASLNTGSLIQHMFTSQLDGFVFPLPPLAEQQRIVAEVERRLSVVEEQERAVERALARAATLRQAILRRAFAGKLVPQDPRDEPASLLLERIRQERAAAGDTARPRRGRAKEKTATAKQGRLFEG